MIADFHFLRPGWLFALIAAAMLGWIAARREAAGAKWRHMIAPHLLRRLLIERRLAARVRPVHLTILLIVLGAVAAAGPTWRRERSPFFEDQAPLAIAIDLSQTMNAIDVSPSRLERAKLKVYDLLERRRGARTAIFAYAGSAHLVLPLTDDARLIRTYVDSLATRIMPVGGKDTAKALAVVEAGLEDEPVPGTILFITDGIEAGAFEAFKRYRGRNEIMVLGIGTAAGGPVKIGVDEFLTDSTGARVLSRLDVEGLRRLRSGTAVRVATFTADDDDVAWIVRRAQSHLRAAQAARNTRWQDAGWWLMIPIAGLGALWFRRAGRSAGPRHFSP